MADETREIPREEWRSYFDDFSRDLPELLATVEIIGGELGAEVEADSTHLTAITYDNKDDILVIGLDGGEDGTAEDAEHIVYGPRRILAAERADETSFEIDDAESVKTILRLERVG